MAGVEAALLAFRLLDPAVAASVDRPDGSPVAPGDAVIRLEGPARPILSAERSPSTCSAGSRVSPPRRHASSRPPARTARPGSSARARRRPACARWRSMRCGRGGGSNHRFGLDDAVLIKDNHSRSRAGSRPAIERARAGVGHLVKIEVEVDTLDQLDEALDLGVDAVLLDNMDPDALRRR